MAKKKAGKVQARRNHNERKAEADPKVEKVEAVEKAELFVPEAPATEPEAAKPALAKGSVVDAVFDHLTGIATKGLSVAKRGLEASARWLDGQAKRAGDLALKLRKTEPTTEAQSSG